MKNKTNIQQVIKLKQENTYTKHFPSSTREWNNSIYVYNKNNLNLIPFSTTYAIKIIKSFFYFYNKILEKKIRAKSILLRFRRLSSNRIYLSKGEFKHTNNNVLINLYIFNRQRINYLSKFNKIYKKLTKKKYYVKKNMKFLNLIYTKIIDTIIKINKNKYSLIRALYIIEENNNYKIKTFKTLNDYVILFYKKMLNLTMKKLRLFFLYKQLIYLNKSKLNYIYLRLLKKHLEKLYNKNVEFNLVNLKQFYLNSDIFTESVKIKIALDKNKMRKMLKKLKIKVKVHKKKPFLGFNSEIKNIYDMGMLKKNIFNKLKYKHITGFRLETKGRLSKRFTASRSVYKLYYKGNLINIDSSFRQEPCVLLKGNLKASTQYTKLSSVTRIGAFGIKGWISGN